VLTVIAVLIRINAGRAATPPREHP